MQGNIEAVKQWPDGGISIKIGQTWYKTKNVEMLQMQGRTITFNPAPWTNPTSSKVTNWINDYVESGAAPGTADQAMAQAMGQPPPMGQPTPPGAYQPDGQPTIQPPQSAPAPQTPQSKGVDRDSYIAAQALAKTLTFQSPKDALDAFKYLYIQLRDWNPEADVPFDDSIPF